MLDEIEELIKKTDDAERIYEATRERNENVITALVETSDAYKNLKKECVGDYKCWIDIYDEVTIKIIYKLSDTFNRQTVYVLKEGIDYTCKLVENEHAKNKLIRLATSFYEEFYVNKEENKSA